MNYTGRPSISGCRPVLSLYPTHCFCQYLLRIFITFTNSSLFTRAFSTNSRKPSQAKALPLGELAGASPTERARLLTENHRRCDSIALTKSLPIAAPAALSCRACPLRHCFAMPPPLPRGGLGSPRKVNGFARGSPTRGNGDDRRQWRKQGGAVGAAASKTQAERGGCWEPQPGLVE